MGTLTEIPRQRNAVFADGAGRAPAVVGLNNRATTFASGRRGGWWCKNGWRTGTWLSPRRHTPGEAVQARFPGRSDGRAVTRPRKRPAPLARGGRAKRNGRPARPPVDRMGESWCGWFPRRPRRRLRCRLRRRRPRFGGRFGYREGGVGATRSDVVEIGDAARQVGGAAEAEFFQRFGQIHRAGLPFEFRQVQRDAQPGGG